MLYNKIIKEMIAERAYYYILDEFNNGNIEKYEAKYTTVKKLFDENKLPLKNVLGEYIVGKPLFIDEEDSFPYCNILRKITLSNEAIDFANYCFNFKNLLDITFYDLWSLSDELTHSLTCDDIEAIINSDFKNKKEIIRNLVQNDYISDLLIKKYGLDCFLKDYDFYNEDEINEDYEFPNSDAIDSNSLEQSFLKRFKNPEKIEKRTVKREINVIKFNGKYTNINSKEIRELTISKYTNRDKCFCQMCKITKPSIFIKVNNLEREPVYFWREMRIALCLECSKRFEKIRNNDLLYKEYLKKLQSIDLKSGNGEVEVLIDEGKTITFSRQHLAEIQEILKFQLNKSNLEDKEK